MEVKRFVVCLVTVAILLAEVQATDSETYSRTQSYSGSESLDRMVLPCPQSGSHIFTINSTVKFASFILEDCFNPLFILRFNRSAFETNFTVKNCSLASIAIINSRNASITIEGSKLKQKLEITNSSNVAVSVQRTTFDDIDSVMLLFGADVSAVFVNFSEIIANLVAPADSLFHFTSAFDSGGPLSNVTVHVTDSVVSVPSAVARMNVLDSGNLTLFMARNVIRVSDDSTPSVNGFFSLNGSSDSQLSFTLIDSSVYFNGVGAVELFQFSGGGNGSQATVRGNLFNTSFVTSYSLLNSTLGSPTPPSRVALSLTSNTFNAYPDPAASAPATIISGAVTSGSFDVSNNTGQFFFNTATAENSFVFVDLADGGLQEGSAATTSLSILANSVALYSFGGNLTVFADFPTWGALNNNNITAQVFTASGTTSPWKFFQTKPHAAPPLSGQQSTGIIGNRVLAYDSLYLPWVNNATFAVPDCAAAALSYNLTVCNNFLHVAVLAKPALSYIDVWFSSGPRFNTSSPDVWSEMSGNTASFWGLDSVKFSYFSGPANAARVMHNNLTMFVVKTVDVHAFAVVAGGSVAIEGNNMTVINSTALSFILCDTCGSTNDTNGSLTIAGNSIDANSSTNAIFSFCDNCSIWGSTKIAFNRANLRAKLEMKVYFASLPLIHPDGALWITSNNLTSKALSTFFAPCDQCGVMSSGSLLVNLNDAYFNSTDFKFSTFQVDMSPSRTVIPNATFIVSNNRIFGYGAYSLTVYLSEVFVASWEHIVTGNVLYGYGVGQNSSFYGEGLFCPPNAVSAVCGNLIEFFNTSAVTYSPCITASPRTVLR